MANAEEPVAKALMAPSSVTVTSQDCVNSNLATRMVDSGASGHYFDDANIRDLKLCLQDYVHLTMPRKIITAGGALLKGTVDGVLQGLGTDDNCNQILVRVDIVGVPGIGRNLYFRLEGFNVIVLLRGESGDLYLLVLDLSADRYGAKQLDVNAVTNAQMCHGRLPYFQAHSLDILPKQDGTGITFEGSVSDCDVCAVG